MAKGKDVVLLVSAALAVYDGVDDMDLHMEAAPAHTHARRLHCRSRTYSGTSTLVVVGTIGRFDELASQSVVSSMPASSISKYQHVQCWSTEASAAGNSPVFSLTEFSAIEGNVTTFLFRHQRWESPLLQRA